MSKKSTSVQWSSQELDEVFNFFDKNSDGTISRGELTNVLQALHRPSSSLQKKPVDIDSFFDRVDLDGNGRIDKEEFEQMMKTLLDESESKKKSSGDAEMGSDDHEEKEEEDEMLAFDVFDRDKDGRITAEELKEVMESFGEFLSDEEAKAMIESADINGDGSIDRSEFLKLMHGEV